MYPAPNTTDPQITSEWDRAWMMAGEIIFTCMYIRFPIFFRAHKLIDLSSGSRDWFLAEAMLNRSVEDVFSYAWNVPDTVLFNAKPYLGAMHTSDLYFLFDGKSIDARLGGE